MAVCRLPSLSLADSRDSSSPDQDPADVPTRILYDNTRLAVARILGDGERKKTRAFSELQSHHLFAEKFGRPGKGNDKGKIENLVGFARRNFMVPIPHAANWEELNARLEADCRRRRECRLRGHTETIGERFERDRAAMLPLPPTSYEACEKVTARVSSLSLVRYRTNDYSVPTQYGHRQVLVKGYVHRVEIGCASEVIARHARSYQRETAVYDPLHYLHPTDEDLSVGTPVWRCSSTRAGLWTRPRRWPAGNCRSASRIGGACWRHACANRPPASTSRSCACFDAVRHLVLCRIERRPPRLDLANWPHLPAANVRATQAADYLALLNSPPITPPPSHAEVAL